MCAVCLRWDSNSVGPPIPIPLNYFRVQPHARPGSSVACEPGPPRVQGPGVSPLYLVRVTPSSDPSPCCATTQAVLLLTFLFIPNAHLPAGSPHICLCHCHPSPVGTPELPPLSNSSSPRPSFAVSCSPCPPSQASRTPRTGDSERHTVRLHILTGLSRTLGYRALILHFPP